MMRCLGPVLVALSLGLAACNEEEAGEEGVTGDSLTIHVAIDPDPPLVDQNTMDIEIVDDSGKGMEGCVVTVDPQMPSMGHGSPEVPVVTDLGGGFYDAFPVTFSMPGTWEVTVGAEHSATQQSATEVVTYEIE